jgi:hypothetical protein
MAAALVCLPAISLHDAERGADHEPDRHFEQEHGVLRGAHREDRGVAWRHPNRVHVSFQVVAIPHQGRHIGSSGRRSTSSTHASLLGHFVSSEHGWKHIHPSSAMPEQMPPTGQSQSS